MNKTLSAITLALSFPCLTLAQEQPVQPDAKLQKYHSVLLKRPSSAPLFQRFQTAWLSQHSEDSLEKFLTESATKGQAGDKQLLAYLQLQKGLEAEAIKTLTSAIQQNAKNAQVFLDRAKAYSRILDFDKAVADVDQALALEKENSAFILEGNKLKGRFLTRKGKTDDAVKHWKLLAKENPDDQELIEDVIDILMADSLAPSALELATALRDKTKDPYKRALRTLRVGDILTKQGERDKALQTYVDTLDLSGSGSWLEREIIAQIQIIYTREENTNGLIDKIAELSKKYPQRTHIKLKHAEVLVEDSRFNDAKAIYQDLIKTSPGDDSLRTSYFNMLKRSGDLVTAKQLIDSMLKLDPNNSQLHLQRASLSHELGDKEATLKDLKSYKKIVKKLPTTALNYASLLNKYKFTDLSIEAYKQAVADYPDSLDVAITSAQFLLLKDKKDEAKAIWKNISTKVDRDGLIRLIDTLSFNNQKEFALELVKNNFEKYKANIPFLKSAIATAEATKNWDLAIKYSQPLVLLSQKPLEIDSAIIIASRLINKAGKVDANIALLQKKANRSTAESFLLADLYETSGEIVKSNEILTKLSASNDPVSLLQSSRIHERRYQLEKSAQIIEQLIKIPNELKAVHLKKLNNLYQRSGNIKKALATIQKWKTLAPNDKQVWLAEVDLLRSTDGAEKALETLRKGAQKFENDTEIYAKLADLNTEASRFGQAKLLYWRLYDDAQDLSGRIRWATALAQTAQREGTTNALIDNFTARRRNSPKSIAPIMALSEVYRITNQYEERRNLLLEATRLRPDDASLLIQVASLDQRQGSQQRAIDILRKAKKLDKTNQASRKLANLLMSEGQIEEAIEELTADQGKQTARSVEGIVFNLIQQELLEEAKKYLNKHLASNSDDWRLLFLDSIIDYELGYNEKSLQTAFSLLSKNNELKSVKTGWTPNNSRFSNPLSSKELPNEHKEFQQLSSASNILQYLVNSGNNYSGFYRGQQAGSGANLPANLLALRLLAKAHILRTLLEYGEKEQQEILTRAEAEGFNNAHLAFELSELSAMNRNQTTVSLPDFLKQKIEQSPDSKFLHNSYILSAVQQNGLKLPKSILEQAKKLNKADGDSFFNDILPYCVNDTVSDEDHNKQIIALIKKDKTIDAREISILFSVNLKYFTNTPTKEKLPENISSLFKQYQKDNDTGEDINIQTVQNDLKLQAIWAIRQLLKLETFKGDDYKAIISLIESDSTNGFNNYQPFYGGGRMSQQPLAFPPRDLTTVTSSQLSHFSDDQENHRSFPPTPALDKKKVGQNLSAFTNPILKVAASLYADKKSNPEAILTEAKKNPKYKADAHLLHAAYLVAVKGNQSKALAELELARESTMNKVQRNSINSYLLNTALASGTEEFKKLDETMQEAIRATARRLMISRAITEANQIQKVLSTFSMEKESSRFLTKNKKSLRVKNQVAPQGGLIGSTSRPTTNRYNPSSQDPFEKRLQQAIQKKQTAQAVNLVYGKFRLLSRQSRYNDWELKQLGEKITKHKLVKPFLERIDPKDSTSPRKWLSYYESAKILKSKQEQARAIKFLSSLPVTPQKVRLPLALAIYKSKPKEALELLSNVRIGLNEVIQTMENDFEQQQENPKDYISTLEFTNQYLKTLDFENASIRNQLSSSMYNYLREANEMMGFSSYSSYKKIGLRDKALQAKQKKAHTEFIGYCLNLQNTADDAFKLKLHSFQKRKIDEKALIKIAKNSLLKTSTFNRHSFGRNSSILPHEINTKYPDRKKFIAQTLLKSKSTDLLDKAFLEQIKKTDLKLHKTLSLYKKTLLLSDKDFIKSADVIKTEHTLEDLGVWTDILQIKPNNKVSLLLAEAFLSYLKSPESAKDIAQNYHQNSLPLKNLCLSAVHTFHKNNRLKEIIEFTDKNTEKYLGTISDKHARWKKDIDQIRYNVTNKEQFIAIRFMQNLLQSPTTFDSALALVEKYQYPLISDEDVFFDNDNKFPAKAYEQILEAGYLANPAKIKISKLPVIKKTASGNTAGNPATAAILGTGNDIANIHYNIQYFAEYYKKYRHYSHSSEQYKAFLEKLEKAPKENKYGADLFLALTKKKTPLTFLKDNIELLKKAPKDHLKIIQDILSIDTNATCQTFLASHKSQQLFPRDEEAIKIKSSGAAKEFLARTKAFSNSSELYKYEKFITDYIKKHVQSDLETTAQVLSHYITLLEKSRNVTTRTYTTRDRHLSDPIQVVLADNVFYSFKTGPTYQFELLRLVYSLTKHPLKHKLNLHRLIRSTMPGNWPFRVEKEIKTKNRGVAVSTILTRAAEKYNTLKNEDEKNFIKASWMVYLSSFHTYERLHFSMYRKKDFTPDLIKKKPKFKEFLEFFQTAKVLEYGYLFDLNISSYAWNADHFKNLDLNKRLRFEKFVDQLEKMFSTSPLLYQSTVINNIISTETGMHCFVKSKNFRKLTIETYIKLVSENPSWGYSGDTRYFTMMGFGLLENSLSADDRVRLSNAAEIALKSQIDFINKKNFIHQNHFVNTAYMLALTKEGSQKLKLLYDKNPKIFKDNLQLAQLFLREGYISVVPKILTNPNDPRYQSELSGKSILSSEYLANLDKLTKLYTSNREKVIIRSLLRPGNNLRMKADTFNISNNYVLKLAEQAAALKESLAIPSTVINSFNHPEALRKLGEFDELNFESSSVSLDKMLNEGPKIYYKNTYSWNGYLRRTLTEKGPDEYLKIITLLVNKIKQNKTGRSMTYEKISFLESSIGVGYATALELYAEADKDAELKKLLPMLRGLNELAVNIRLLGFTRPTFIAYSKWYWPFEQARAMTKILHQDLGEEKSYKAWLSKLPKKNAQLMNSPYSKYLLFFLKDIRLYSQQRSAVRINSHFLPFFKRLLNSPAFQDTVVKNEINGGIMDYAVATAYISPIQAIDIYDAVKINYSNPLFEAFVHKDLAYIKGLSHDPEIIIEHYQKMDEIIKANDNAENNPSKRSLYHFYSYASSHLTLLGKTEASSKFSPKGPDPHKVRKAKEKEKRKNKRKKKKAK